SPATPQPKRTRRRILILHRDPLVRDVLKQMLADAGLEASATERAWQLLEWAASNPRVLIVLGWTLPPSGEDSSDPWHGARLVARLRALHGESLPILAIVATEAEFLDAQNTGVSRCVMRPVRLGHLLRTIQSLLI